MHSGITNYTEYVPEGRSVRDKKRRQQRILAWWYFCVGLAFILLGIRSLIRGDQPWSIALRFVIACGFLALAAGMLRTFRAGRDAG